MDQGFVHLDEVKFVYKREEVLGKSALTGSDFDDSGGVLTTGGRGKFCEDRCLPEEVLT